MFSCITNTGEHGGVIALLKKDNPEIIHTNCGVHQFSLANKLIDSFETAIVDAGMISKYLRVNIALIFSRQKVWKIIFENFF